MAQEVISCRTEKFTVSLEKNPERAIVLDIDRKNSRQVIGEIKDGMYFIQPVSDTVSYLLKF